MKLNLLRKILAGFSLTSALFIFQACYGTEQDIGISILLEGQVKSKNSNKPLKGIKVSILESGQYQFTNEDGSFSFFTESSEKINIKFQDIDSTQNGHYAGKDTCIKASYADNIYLNIQLENK